MTVEERYPIQRLCIFNYIPVSRSIFPLALSVSRSPAVSSAHGSNVADNTITSALVGRVMLFTVLAEFNGKR